MSEFVIRIEGIGDSERIAQLEEIVRCRDCAYSSAFILDYWAKAPEDGSYVFCTKFQDRMNDVAYIDVEPDGFCKWGERRGA